MGSQKCREVNRPDGCLSLLENQEFWRKHWKGMPEFVQEDVRAVKVLEVKFGNTQAVEDFSLLVGQDLGKGKKYIWFPETKNMDLTRMKCVGGADPKYPVYIISKGRWESRLTSKALERMNVPYHIVIEPQEYDDYASVINPAKILVLPFSNLGQGSIPARNWVWEHSLSIGAERHWILDDNIDHFYRLHKNVKWYVFSGATFKAAEDFTDRYENVAMAGMQYEFFAPRKRHFAPFTVNSRVYSCLLIKNDIPFRWRGRYNEDTDLSLRVLKDGWCTVLFNAFLAGKTATMSMKGGNTDELYGQDGEFDGRLAMAESLREQHPDVATIVKKWGRWQHKVDYGQFKHQVEYKGIEKNTLRLKRGIVIEDGVNNYGMEFVVEDDAE